MLYRILFEGETRVLSSLYNGMNTLCVDPTISLSHKVVKTLPTHFPSKQGVSSSDLEHMVFVPAKNQAGYDIIYVEKQATSDESVIVCVECRFSDITASSTLSLPDINKKYKLVQDRFRPYFSGSLLYGHSVKEENTFLIFCAFRKLSNEIVVGNLPKNIIVMGREQLKGLYTPSLSSRPQFISSRADGVADDVKKR